jgi:hypothetical protein
MNEPSCEIDGDFPSVPAHTCHCDHGHIVLLNSGYTVLQVGIPKDGTYETANHGSCSNNGRIGRSREIEPVGMRLGTELSRVASKG